MSQRETHKEAIKEQKNFVSKLSGHYGLSVDLMIITEAKIIKNETVYTNIGKEVLYLRAASLSKLNKKGCPSYKKFSYCKLEFEKRCELSCIIASLLGIRIPIKDIDELKKILPAFLGKKFFAILGESRFFSKERYFQRCIYKIFPYIPFPDPEEYTDSRTHFDYAGSTFMKRQKLLCKKIVEIYKENGLVFG